LGDVGGPQGVVRVVVVARVGDPLDYVCVAHGGCALCGWRVHLGEWWARVCSGELTAVCLLCVEAAARSGGVGGFVGNLGDDPGLRL
jgi:hypothetical protein